MWARVTVLTFLDTIFASFLDGGMIQIGPNSEAASIPLHHYLQSQQVTFDYVANPSPTHGPNLKTLTLRHAITECPNSLKPWKHWKACGFRPPITR